MPDPHRIAGELLPLLSHPQYVSMFTRRNQYRNQYHFMKKPSDPVLTAKDLAHKTAWDVFHSHGLLNPVDVRELPGPLELYRAYDGGVRVNSAGTLGRWWFDRRVVQEIWNVTERYPGLDRKTTFMEFLRAANFISPEFNDMTQMAVMLVPTGCSIVVIRGKGDWKALRTAPGAKLAPGATPLLTQEDVISKLGMMPIPGTIQYMVPLFNDSWVTQVPRLSSKWPLYS